MIEQSKVDIDYDRLQRDRQDLSVSERQMDRVGGSYTDRPLIDGGHILAGMYPFPCWRVTEERGCGSGSLL